MSFRFSSKTGVVALIATLIVAFGLFAVSAVRPTAADPVGNPIVTGNPTKTIIQLFNMVGPNSGPGFTAPPSASVSLFLDAALTIPCGSTPNPAPNPPVATTYCSVLLLVSATESGLPAGNQDVTPSVPDTNPAASVYTASSAQLNLLPTGTGITFNLTTTLSCPVANGTVWVASTQNGVTTTSTTTCTAATANNVTIWKVDQNNNPVGPATFVIEMETPLGSNIWLPVATLWVGQNGVAGGNPLPNGCSTSNGLATFVPPVAPVGLLWGPIPNSVCSAPSSFVTGPGITPVGPLANGTYRAREISAPPQFCTVSNWNFGRPDSLNLINGNPFGGGAPNNFFNNVFFGFSGNALPVQFTLPATGVGNNLDITNVNSCAIPAAPSAAGSQLVVVIGGSSQGTTNTTNVELHPAPGSDDDARVDLRIRDSNNVPIPNAHVTVSVDKGRIAGRLDCSSGTCSGVDVVEPTPPNFGQNYSGDTCDYVLAQSQTTGGIASPFLIASNYVSAAVQDVFTNVQGIASLCWFVGDDLVPGITPGIGTLTAIVELPGSFVTYSPISSANLILTAKLTIVGPPASITVAASPSTLNCGEKSTVTVTVKDAANQNVSDHTRVEAITNFGGVLGGTGGTLGYPGVGPVNPVSSAAAETFNGTATMFLLTSTEHVGPYEVVVTSGGSTGGINTAYINPLSFGLPLAPGGQNSATYFGNAANPPYTIVAGNPVQVNSFAPIYNVVGGTGVFSTPPVSSQVTVNCAVPAAAAPIIAPVIQAPRTGEGPTIRPPNTGDAGLRTQSSGSSSLLLFAAVGALALSGAGLVLVRRASR